jgi:hypothetical protein
LKRRDFLLQGSIITTGISFRKLLPVERSENPEASGELYSLFRDPSSLYRPFVRWWWNGDKVEKAEISRELRLLKDAGIGGVEINPIRFPARTNDLGKKPLKWLSPEWTEMVHFAADEARSLGLVCDLIVGSGWPFGAEWLQGDERTQMVSVAIKKLEGPLDYEISLYELFHEADPAVTSPYTGRTMELVSLHLIPSPLNKLEDIKEITASAENGNIKFSVDAGSFGLYALVSINGFMEVINGAYGADGAVLNHYNQDAVEKYLNKMSSALKPEPDKFRAFFIDSLELEGSNWCHDMLDEFKKRRGYDLSPFLPFILFKTAGMGNVFDYTYGIQYTPALKEKLNRIRYDFEITKTALLHERFVQPFIRWCKENKVASRMQAYGRGYHPLEGSLGVDIPECETWIQMGIGLLMGETDYREGRAYTMINKYVSSAAHLQGKKEISCEELTNTEHVFNATLELLKIASDQSIISGATHPVFHGFNYSPKEADFPGWVRYGTFFNERNPWWPYLQYFTAYRARLAALLQQGDMFADIALLPAVADMWSIYGAQNEPFPTVVHPAYQTLVWEAIHKNGRGCDYISEKILHDSIIHDRYIVYGPRKYRELFLIEVESVEPATLEKLLAFVQAGGRVFCIEKYPGRACGWFDYDRGDQAVSSLITKLKAYPDRFIFLQKPQNDFIGWYKGVQQHYQITPYVQIKNPDPFINQVRYQTKKEEIFFFINSNSEKSYSLDLSFSSTITQKRQAWIWNPETGERQMLKFQGNNFSLSMGPAASKLIIFESQKNGKLFTEPNLPEANARRITKWTLEWQHIDGSRKVSTLEGLKDVKEIAEFSSFCGSIIYRAEFEIPAENMPRRLDLGKVYGVSEVLVNGMDCGVSWYGRRNFDCKKSLKAGKNTFEIRIATTMGNYMKTLKDNPVAQYWTNEKRKDQPVQSMGMTGPVTIY